MLENMKLLLGIDPSDSSLDKKLELLISTAKDRLQVLLGGVEPPKEMEHIIIEAAIIRFNRIGSEGLSSHSVEGESLTFSNGDFDSYTEEIRAFLDTNEGSTIGKVRFI